MKTHLTTEEAKTVLEALNIGLHATYNLNGAKSDEVTKINAGMVVMEAEDVKGGDERALFEANTLDLFPAATFNRFASGRYNVSWI